MKLWIDALDFNVHGGWKLDTQHVHLMGSGYLIAADQPGVPVEDATVSVEVPESGMYRIWARTRNWMRWHSPGQFKLLADGQDFGNVLGRQPSDAWLWEIAGDVQLEKGTHTLSLHDLTGYFGRCSSLILTTDMDYVPSREIERWHKERALIKGLPTDTVDGGEYDLIVVGGGPGGVPAAIAAAREGVRVLLLQDRPIPGGNGSSEVGITFDGASVKHMYGRETGIAEEIRRLRDRELTSNVGDWTRAIEKLLAQEPNVTVLYNKHVCDAVTENEIIRQVIALDMHTLTKTCYRGKMFMDCTGDGWLGYRAGAKYRYGREAFHQHNESIAPEVADTLTMSGCLKSGNRAYFEIAKEEVPFEAPVWVPRLPAREEDFGRFIEGNGASMLWWLELPNEYDDMWDAEEARDALFLVALGYYHHIKNDWARKDRAKNVRMRFPSVFVGKRESRRLVGDYILTQEDCQEGRIFEDAISYSGWALDVHHPKGIYSGSEGPLHCNYAIPMATVPYRCLYSQNIGNLMFAGRDISTTHVAIGTVRVQNTLAAIGQAAGTAAAMCIKLNESPRGIYQKHMHDLQQLLIKNDMYIPGFKNEDPADPCLTATAEASSVSRVHYHTNIKGTEEALLPMDTDRCCVFRVTRHYGDVTSVWLKLYNETDAPIEATLRCDDRLGDLYNFYKYKEVNESKSPVPPGESWVKFDVFVSAEGDPAIDGCNIRLSLDACPGLYWRSLTNMNFYSKRGKKNEQGKWEMVGSRCLCASTVEPAEVLADCGPQNVINGYSRIVSPDQFEWVSDPNEAMPQWLQLTFAQPTEIDRIAVVFDTDLSNPGTCWSFKIPEVPCCVKDYTVEVFDGTAWHTVAEVTGNFMRKRIHDFAALTAEKVRITVLATCGDASARILEVRASKEP